MYAYALAFTIGVCLPMCFTVGPMARGGGGDITGNGLGQGFTSNST